MNDGMPVSNDDDDYYYVLVTPVYKSSAAAEMGDRLATIDMDRKVARAAMGGAGSPLGHHLTQCGLGRGLPLYQWAETLGAGWVPI